MTRQVLRSVFMITLLFALSRCSSNNYGAAPERIASSSRGYSAPREWDATDLGAGPVAIVKGVGAVVICPMRQVSQTFENTSNSDSGGSRAGEFAVMPFKAIIDGAFTGVGYVAGGVLDTVSGGVFHIVQGATGTDEPNGNLSCILSGGSD